MTYEDHDKLMPDWMLSNGELAKYIITNGVTVNYAWYGDKLVDKWEARNNA